MLTTFQLYLSVLPFLWFPLTLKFCGFHWYFGDINIVIHRVQMEFLPMNKVLYINGKLNCLVACKIGKGKYGNYVILGQFNIDWLPEFMWFLSTGVTSLVLLCRISYGLCGGTLKGIAMRTCKKNGCTLFCMWFSSLLPPYHILVKQKLGISMEGIGGHLSLLTKWIHYEWI